MAFGRSLKNVNNLFKRIQLYIFSLNSLWRTDYVLREFYDCRTCKNTSVRCQIYRCQDSLFCCILEKHSCCQCMYCTFDWKKRRQCPSGQKCNQKTCVMIFFDRLSQMYSYHWNKNPITLDVCLGLPHSYLYPRKGGFSWGCYKPSCWYPPPHHPWLLRAGTAPSTRPTSLRRYFLTKTYHLRLDPSADYAEAAAALAHNPPQASTSLSLPLLSLCSLLQFLLFFAAFSHQVFQMLPSSHISVRFFKLFSFFSCCLCASGWEIIANQ